MKRRVSNPSLNYLGRRQRRAWLKRLSPQTIVLAIFFVVLVSYVGYQTRALAEGPRIVLESPGASGTTFKQPLVTIVGNAERISHLFLNGGRIFTDEAGRFSEKLLLAPGYNLISLTAQDRFARVIERQLELIYEPSL